MTRRCTPIETRFWQKVRQTPGCWLWTGATSSSGYGVFQRGRRGGGLIRAHRFSFELRNGPVPDGLLVMHSCNTKICVNPAHLSAGSYSDNIQDAWDDGLRPVPANHLGIRLRKVTPEQVRAMRAAYTGMRGECSRLAGEYGLTYQGAYSILSGRNWKDI